MTTQRPSSGFVTRLRQRLNKGDSWLTRDVTEFLPGKKLIDEDLLEELETRLLTADAGVEVTEQISSNLSKRLKRKELDDPGAVIDAVAHTMEEILYPCERPLEITDDVKPFVILMVGVNGSGKTTTIGKLAKRFKHQQKKVMLAAGDTFRAAAVEQLQTWGTRNDVPVVAQQTGADPSAVLFDALTAAKARDIDVLIADTAGRLHTQQALMDELKKIKRVLGKIDPSAPHEVMLVVDAVTGQNALQQAKQFNAAVELTGITVTKLDGTARAGILLALANSLRLPVRFIGIGEQADDLDVFTAREFVGALLGQPAVESQ
ncbi:MAG: signal recognition particle-docking protein FtsY [Gammaproteobacteria bacterium]|nr:signal recognition particle-docking protein FtsY [Gammaproteobacteria bacterium]